MKRKYRYLNQEQCILIFFLILISLIILINNLRSFDLHQYYSKFEAAKKEKQIEWNQVDQDIYLPYHYQLNRVPCTFEPTGKNLKFETIALINSKTNYFSFYLDKNKNKNNNNNNQFNRSKGNRNKNKQK
jgi:hypothetical protein